VSEGIGPVTAQSTPGGVSTPPPLDQRLRDEVDRAADVWLPAARALRVVLELHKPQDPPMQSYCDGCCQDCMAFWPCPVVEAIAEQLGVEL
jgi:hypothetical protein